MYGRPRTWPKDGMVVRINEPPKVPPFFEWLDKLLALLIKPILATRENPYMPPKWLTNISVYEYAGLPMPTELEEFKHERITNKNELIRTGIIVTLELKIKEVLNVCDRIESGYKNFDGLDNLEITYLTSLVNSKDGYDHPFAELLREKIKRRRARGGINEAE